MLLFVTRFKNHWSNDCEFTLNICFNLRFIIMVAEFEFFDHTIEFSPVIVPIITLLFLFLVFQQFYELSRRLIEPNEQSMA